MGVLGGEEQSSHEIKWKIVGASDSFQTKIPKRTSYRQKNTTEGKEENGRGD